jgi:DNA repair protein RecO (recombination protein O)
MQWNDKAIILSVRPHGESSALCKLFSRHHGLYAGMVRLSKKNRPAFQPGSHVDATWKARLEEHLGTITSCELEESCLAHILDDGLKLTAITAGLTLTEHSLAERDPHPILFDYLSRFIHSVTRGQKEHWLAHYVRLELDLLNELGFALDLTSCADTGLSENLTYVSPRSGRAVSEESGKPYHKKLLPLPRFLADSSHVPSLKEIEQGLLLTGFFLERHLFMDTGRKIPATRGRLLDMLARRIEAEINAPA